MVVGKISKRLRIVVVTEKEVDETNEIKNEENQTDTVKMTQSTNQKLLPS